MASRPSCPLPAAARSRPAVGDAVHLDLGGGGDGGPPRHYANAADASSLGGIQLWDKARRMWTADLPVTSLMLDWIASAQGGMEGPERVRHFEESRNRALCSPTVSTTSAA